MTTGRSATSCIPRGLLQGDEVVSGPGSDIRTGNALPLGEVPLGTVVHNIELKPGKGGQIVRSAGTGAQVVAKEGRYVTLRHALHRGSHGAARSVLPPSGRSATPIMSSRCSARRARPAGGGGGRKVRGVAMNPVDHPLGGGEGRTSGGRPPVSPWGKREV